MFEWKIATIIFNAFQFENQVIKSVLRTLWDVQACVVQKTCCEDQLKILHKKAKFMLIVNENQKTILFAIIIFLLESLRNKKVRVKVVGQ